MTALVAPLLILSLPSLAWKKRLITIRNLILCAIPAILLLAYTVKTTRSDLKNTKQSSVNEAVNESFLDSFGAHAIDYLTSDIRHGDWDWNPLRRKLNNIVLNNWDNSNPHERTNGIRWIILGAFIIALFSLKRSKRILYDKDQQHLFVLFFGLTVLGFIFSLPLYATKIAGISVSPVALLHYIVPEFRITNRFGVIVSFGILGVVGMCVNEIFQEKKLSARRKAVLGVLFSLMVVGDFPPVLPVKMTTLADPPQELLEPHCGYGIYLTKSVLAGNLLPYYQLLGTLRATDCKILNHPGLGSDVEGIQRQFTDSKRQNHFLKCTNTRWILADERDPFPHFKDICTGNGGTLPESNLCLLKMDKLLPIAKNISDCFTE